MPRLVYSHELVVRRLKRLTKNPKNILNLKLSTTKRRGVTLVELLVVITIIGVISSLSIGVISNRQAEARDAQRKVDLESIKTALELYYQQNTEYSNATGGAEQYSSDDIPANPDGPWILTLRKSYIKSLPKDPKQNTPGSNPSDCNSTLPYTYCYKVATGSQSYELWARLERTDDPEISSNPSAKCTLPPPNANFNYCLESN